MAKILIIDGENPGWQGYGDNYASARIRDSLRAEGKAAEILMIQEVAQIRPYAANYLPDLVWSNLYFPNYSGSHVGTMFRALPPEQEVNRYVETLGLAHVAPDAATLRVLANKSTTRERLHGEGVAVPEQYVVPEDGTLPELTWPGLRLVKPLWEAESRGVSEASVVNTKQEMAEAVRAIWHQFNQEALVEEYLPGPEYTVTLAGNGSDALAMGLITHFNPDYYEKYPLITPNLKDGGLSYQRLVGKEEVEICSLAKHAAEAVGACDHVRVDIRRDAQGIAKVLEVNGIPGLQPGRSRSLALHAMYFPELDEATNHRQLVNRIVDAALKRNDLE